MSCSLLGGMNTKRVCTAPPQAHTESFLSAAAFPTAMARLALKQHLLDMQLQTAAQSPAQPPHQKHSTHSKPPAYRKLYAQYVWQGPGWIPCSRMQSIHHRDMSMPATLSGTACTSLEETVVSRLLFCPGCMAAWGFLCLESTRRCENPPIVCCPMFLDRMTLSFISLVAVKTIT